MKTELSPELAEFVGIVMGDGYIYLNKGKYLLGIVGHPKKDRAHFKHINDLIMSLFQHKPTIVTRARGLRLTLYSKQACTLLTKEIGLVHGKGKGENVTIPQVFLKDDSLLNSLIRGLFDTDGSIFTSNKKGAPDYPTIELTTTSIRLAEQVRDILIKKGFRVANVRRYKSKRSVLDTHKVSLYGHKNMMLWREIIGFSNSYKQERLRRISGSGVI
ncbi:hypothetical protein JW711_03565 [Candidatus Woesearchaeota archaeon]|nr:hypothetical protein [Candidatus Woesearchaeota archaeon]